MTPSPSTPRPPQLIADADTVSRRITEMAVTIVTQYKNQNPLFICLLRGGAPFATQLMFAITQHDPTFHPEMDYLTIKTYGDERTSKTPQLIADILPTTKTQQRHVILLDDVLDKGITADFAQRHMLQHHAAKKVDLIVLLQKTCERPLYPQATLWGFAAPDVWLRGMGLDNPAVAREADRWNGGVFIA